MTPEEKLREMLKKYARNEETAAGEHLRDEDLRRLAEDKTISEMQFSTKNNGASSTANDELAAFRVHLANCDSCLDHFEDFYAFYAPAAENELVAGKREVESAWQDFAPRIAAPNESETNNRPNFWARLFPSEKKINYFAALGWGFAALLLLSSIISIFVAQRTNNEKAQLAGEIENQKQTYAERLKTLEQSAQNRELAEQEKARLTEEKDALQTKIAQLQTEIERAKQEKTTRENNLPTNINRQTVDNSLVAINTPIYDVFPSDSAVRSNGQSQNDLTIPANAKNIVMILNAAGRADFSSYRAELVSSAGAIIWRGAGLKKDNLGNFTLTLSRNGLKNGNYRIKLFGKNDSNWQIISEYPIRVEIK